jgi:hypothetical protein
MSRAFTVSKAAPHLHKGSHSGCNDLHLSLARYYIASEQTLCDLRLLHVTTDLDR